MVWTVKFWAPSFSSPHQALHRSVGEDRRDLQAGEHQVQVLIAVYVERAYCVSAPMAGHIAVGVRSRAVVLQPGDSVELVGVGPLRKVPIEEIAVGDQDIGVAVPVQVRQLDARHAVVVDRGAEEHLFGKGAAALIAEEEDLLEVLREGHRQVQVAVAVGVEGEGVDDAWAVVEDVLLEGEALLLL